MSEMNKSLRHDPPAMGSHGKLLLEPAVNPPLVRSRSGTRPAASAEQGITLRFVLTALRRWWMVATPIGLVLAAIGGAGVYLWFEPAYQAEAWFMIQERTPYVAFESRDEGRSKSFFQTQTATIRSPFVLGPVIQRPEIAGAADRQASR